MELFTNLWATSLPTGHCEDGHLSTKVVGKSLATSEGGHDVILSDNCTVKLANICQINALIGIARGFMMLNNTPYCQQTCLGRFGIAVAVCLVLWHKAKS